MLNFRLMLIKFLKNKKNKTNNKLIRDKLIHQIKKWKNLRVVMMIQMMTVAQVVAMMIKRLKIMRLLNPSLKRHK